jgi:Fur family ferric uptake transcriptional regulator
LRRAAPQNPDGLSACFAAPENRPGVGIATSRSPSNDEVEGERTGFPPLPIAPRLCHIVANAGKSWSHADMSATNDLLRSAGIKVTPGRVRVLEALLASHGPMSHANIEALLPDTDRVTLYRVLDSLVNCGLALRAVDARGIFRFSASGARREHQGHVHFRCTECGGVFCLEASPPSPPKLPRGFVLSEVEYDVRGVCAGCRKKFVSADLPA